MTRSTRRVSFRNRLALSASALAGSFGGLMGSAQAQSLPTNASVVDTKVSLGGLAPQISNQNATPGAPNPDTLRVNLRATNTVINWNGFNVPENTTANFVDGVAGPGQLAVLNRDVNPANNPSQIRGSIVSDSNVAVWVMNANGITIGPNAAVNTGSFVATTLDIADADFTSLLDNDFALTAPAGRTAGITIQNGATIITAGGNRGLVLVAPAITVQGGGDTTTFDAGDQDVAFVTATDVTLDYDLLGGPLQVTLGRGTSIAAGQVVRGEVSGRNVYFAMATQAAVTDALLNVEAAVTADAALVTDTGIVLSAGRSVGPVTVTANAGTSGAVDIETGDATITAGDDGGQIRVTGNGGIVMSGLLEADRAVTVDGEGDVTLADIDAGRTIDITAGGVAAVTGDVTSLREYRVTGASVELGLDGDGETQRADQAVVITSTGGAIRGGENLVLRSNHEPAGNEALTLEASGGGIAFADSSSIEGGPARQSNVRIRIDTAARDIVLGDIAANSLVSAIGAAGFANGLSTDGDITLGTVDLRNTLDLTSSTGDIALGSARVTNAGTDILIEATTGSLTADGLLIANDDVELSAGGALSTAAVTASNGTIAIESTGAGVTIDGALIADDDATITAATLTEVRRGVTAGGAYRVTGAEVSLGVGSGPLIQAADGAVVIEATGGGITGSSGLTVRSAADGGAGGFLILSATGAIDAAGTALDAGASDVGLTAGSGTTIVLGDITGARIGNANGTNTGVLATFTHDADVTLGDLDIDDDLIDVTLTAGALTAGTITASDGVRLTVAGLVTVDDIEADQAVFVRGSAIDAAAVRSVDAEVDLATTTGDLTATSLSADGAIDAVSTGDLAVTGAITAGADLTLRGADVALGVGAASETQSAGGGVLVEATGTITGGANLTLASGSGTLTLSAATIAFAPNSLLRGGPAGTQRDVQIRSTLAAGGVTLGDVRARSLLGAVGADAFTTGLTRSSDITVRNVDLVNTLRLESTGSVTVGSVDVSGAGQGISLTAGGTLTAPDDFTASGDITLVGANALTLGNVTSATGTVTAQSTAGTLDIGDAVAQDGIALSALNGLTVGRALSDTGATILSSTAAGVSTGDLRGGTVTVTAAGEAAITGDVTAAAGDYRVTGATVRLGAADADGESQRATGRIDITSTTGDISGTGGLILRSDAFGNNAGDILILDAAGGIALDADTTLQGGSEGTVGIGIRVGAGQAIELGDIEAAQFGAIDATHTVITSGLVHDAAIRLGTVVITEGALSLQTSTGAITTADVIARTDIALATSNGAVAVGELEAQGGSVLINATSAVTGNALTGRTGVSVAGSSVDLEGVTASAGSVLVTAPGNIALGNVEADTTITVTSSAGNVAADTLEAGSDISVGAFGTLSGDTGARASVTSDSGSILLEAGGEATLGAVLAAVDLTVRAADIDATSLTATGGTLTLEATASNLSLGDLVGATGIDVRAAGGLSVASATSSGGFVSLVSAAGSTTVNDISARTNATVSAATAARVTGNVTAGGNYAVSGNTVLLGNDADSELQRAAGAITLTSTGGAITGGTGLTLRSDSNGVGGGTLQFNLGATGSIAFANAVVQGGADRTAPIRVTYSGAGPSLVFGDVSGSRFQSFDGVTSFGNGLNLAGGAFVSDDLDFGGPLRITGAGPITTGSVNADGGATLLAGGALRVDGAVTGDGFTGAGSLIALGGDVTVTGPIVLTSAAGLTGSALSSDGAIRISAGRIGLDSVEAGGLADLSASIGDVRIDTVQSGGALTVDAAGAVRGRSVARASLTSTGGNVGITAGTNATLGAVSASGNAVVTANTINASSLMGIGGLVRARAGAGPLTLGAVTAGNLADLSATQALDVGTIDAGSADLVGRTVEVDEVTLTGALDAIAATGDLTLGLGDVGRATLTAGSGTVFVTTGLDANGPVVITGIRARVAPIATTGGNIVLSLGTGGLAGTTSGRASLSAGGDITGTITGGSLLADVIDAGGVIDLTAATIDATNVDAGASLTLETTVGDLTLGTGNAGNDLSLASAGDIGFTTLDSGGAITLTALTGDVTGTSASAAGTITTQAGGLVDIDSLSGSGIGTTAATIDLATIATAGDLTLTSTAGALILGSGAAGGNATLVSATDLTVTGTLSAGADATLSAGAALNAGTIDSTGIAAITATGVARVDTLIGAAIAAEAASVAIGSGMADGSVVIDATAGDLSIDTGLDAGTTVALTATGGARIASVTTTNGGITISAGDVTGATADARATLAAGGAGSLLDVMADGVVRLGALTGAGGITVQGTSVDASSASASGGAISITATTGDLILSGGSAGGAITLVTPAAARVGALTAGNAATLSLTAADAALDGAVSAGTVELTLAESSDNGVNLGDEPGASGGFDLSADELGRISADQLTIDARDSDVAIGALLLADAAGRSRVDVLTTGAMSLTGRFEGSGAGRTVRLGGDADTNALASQIGIASTADGGGRLIFEGANLELRGGRIVMGLRTGFLDVILGGNLDSGAVAGQFVSNSNSALYNSSLTGQVYADRTTLVANTLTVRFDDYALFQNTEIAGLNGGLVLGNAGSPAMPALVIDARPGGNAGAFAGFGSINGITGSAASLLGPTVIQIEGSDPANTRFNGCLIGSGAGCLTATVIQPVLNVFDSSRVDVLRTADDLTLPFDPVVGTNNEALFSGLGTVTDSVASEECATETPSAQCENQETTTP